MEVGGLRSADYSAKRGAEAEEDIRKGTYGETSLNCIIVCVL